MIHPFSIIVSCFLAGNQSCVNNDKKVVFGHSKPTPYRNFVSTHAEMDVCRKLFKRNVYDKKASVNLCVVRYTKDGKFAMSRPCKHCIKCLQNLSQTCKITIKRIYYSIDGCIASEKFADMVKASGYISSGELVRRQNKCKTNR